MESRFKIRKKNQTVSYVQLVINSEKKRVVISTNFTIETKNWGKGFPLKINATKELRSSLETLKLRTDHFIQDTILKENRKPTKFEWRQFKDELKGNSKTSQLIKEFGSRFLEQRKKIVADSTYSSLALHITRFSTFAGCRSMEDMDKSLFHDFKHYLLSLNLEISTVNGYLKNLKAFLNWLYDNDYTVVNFSKYVKKEKQVKKPIIAILESELIVLEEANLENNRLDRIRDLFLFSCYTGLRFSDVRNFTKKVVSGDVLIIRQQKTGGIVTIPLIDQTRDILEKNDYTLPILSEQKANEYLKDLFRHLKLDREVVKTSQTSRSLADTYLKLSDAITFHIARKSFISIALRKGMNQAMVMKISGHQKYSEFQKYIVFANEDLSTEMNKMSLRA